MLIAVELSLGLGLLASLALSHWWQLRLPKRDDLLVPAVCLALAAGSQTAVRQRAMAPDQVVWWTATGLGWTLLVLGVLFVLHCMGSMLLIVLGVRPLGHHVPFDVAWWTITGLVVGGGVVMVGVFPAVGVAVNSLVWNRWAIMVALSPFITVVRIAMLMRRAGRPIHLDEWTRSGTDG